MLRTRGKLRQARQTIFLELKRLGADSRRTCQPGVKGKIGLLPLQTLNDRAIFYERPLVALCAQQMRKVEVSLRGKPRNGTRRHTLRRRPPQVAEDSAQQFGITPVHAGIAAVHQHIDMIAAFPARQLKQICRKVASSDEIHHGRQGRHGPQPISHATYVLLKTACGAPQRKQHVDLITSQLRHLPQMVQKVPV